MHRLAPMHPSFGLAWPDFGFELGDALKCGVGDSVFLRCVFSAILLMGLNFGTDVSTACAKTQEPRS